MQSYPPPLTASFAANILCLLFGAAILVPPRFPNSFRRMTI